MINQTAPTSQDYKEAEDASSVVSKALLEAMFLPAIKQTPEINEKARKAYEYLVEVVVMCNYQRKANDIQGRKQKLKSVK